MSRRIKRNKSGKDVKEIPSIDSSNTKVFDYRSGKYLTKSQLYDNLKGNNKKSSSTFSSKVFILIALLIFGSFSLGIFSPEISPNSGDDLTEFEITGTTFEELIQVDLYSSATCNCCHEYVNYLNRNGFDTHHIKTSNYKDIKLNYGISEIYQSCHTSVIGQYFVEGHIPASVIYNLLENQPEIDGISLPQMPAGSPGMNGEKDGDWIIYSIIKGTNIGPFIVL